MADTRRLVRKRADARAVAEPGLTAALGCIVLLAMEEIASVERFCGDALVHEYSTQFPVDGQLWELKLAKVEDADAR